MFKIWRPTVNLTRWSLQEALHWGHQREQAKIETGENKQRERPARTSKRYPCWKSCSRQQD